MKRPLISPGAAALSLAFAAALTILMGLIPQVEEGGVPWLSRMTCFWPFILVWAWVAALSLMAAVKRLLRWKLKEIPFVLNHLGVAVTIVAVTLSNAGMQRLHSADQGLEMLVDPWRAWVTVGICIMMAGALCQILFMAPRPSGRRSFLWTAVCAALLCVAFLGITLSATGPLFDNPNPELRSPWFAPHVIVYMIAYALLAAATVTAVYMLVRNGGAKALSLTDSLVFTGLAFLTVGMLLGAFWAREAWGSYWAWDPKETWAAATWLCYLLYVHLRKARPGDWKAACCILLAGFVCLQICWWGVNYLPSAKGHSVHTYN
jgi:ABC-type transport system involved in cytochrome c biogenesis permease subunit